MKVYAIQCNKCGDIIYSRARHDMRWCSCNSCAIDGGQNNYIKISGDRENYHSVLGGLEVNTTIEELYNDWNKGINKLGLIKG